jgi:hypothetical protein
LTIINSNISAILLARSAKDSASLDPGTMYLVMAVVSLFLFVLILVFLRKRVVILVRLWYFSLVYGRYSYEFLNFFKENNLRSPINGCVKDEITLHLLVFFKKIKDSQEFHTNTAIDFGEIPYMTTSKKLFKIKGKPDCMKVVTANDTRFIVAGYHETLQGLKMKSLYFFVDGFFVMGEFLFSELIRVNPANLVKTLSVKYLSDATVESDVFYIRDTNGNQLNYEHNGFSISIKYLFMGDGKTNEKLSGLLNSGEFSENSVSLHGNEELLDRF